MQEVINPHAKDLEDDAYSRVLLPVYYGCRCDPVLLTGAGSEAMATKLIEAANDAGLGVQGDAKITLFGATKAERMASGPTIEFVLKASGFAIDFWPGGKLLTSDGRIVGRGTGHGNLHYCKRDVDYDNCARDFAEILRRDVLNATCVEIQGPFDMSVNKILP